MAKVKLPDKPHVAIYTRVSTLHQIDKDSLPMQRQDLINYARLILNTEDYVVYEDAGYSGKNTDRPKFQEMMQQVRLGMFTHILVWKIDRISRNLLDFATMYSELKQLGVVFVSKNEQFDTSSAMGEAMLKIILVFAELERNMTSERVTLTMLSRANNGQWNGGRIPYGYDYDKETKQFSVNSKEAAIVKKVYLLYDQYRSLIYVCRHLNNLGLKTRAGNEWNVPGVYKILTSPFYTGAYQYNVHNDGKGIKKNDKGEWITVENHHPAIVSKKDFDRISNVLSKNRIGGVPKGKTYIRKNIHVFSGLMKCGICGANMSSALDSPHANDGWQPSLYFCSRKRGNTSSCTNRMVSESIFGGFIINYIANIIRIRDSVTSDTSLAKLERSLLQNLSSSGVTGIDRQSLESLKEMLVSGRTGIEYNPPIAVSSSSSALSEKNLLESQYSSNEAALSRLKSLYLYSESGISESEYISERNEIISRLQDIEKKLKEIKSLDQEEIISSKDFISRASYFVMVQRLLIDSEIDYRKFSQSIDKSIQRSFFTSVIKEIYVANGKVTSIEFKNGIITRFKYK